MLAYRWRFFVRLLCLCPGQNDGRFIPSRDEAPCKGHLLLPPGVSWVSSVHQVHVTRNPLFLRWPSRKHDTFSTTCPVHACKGGPAAGFPAPALSNTGRSTSTMAVLYAPVQLHYCKFMHILCSGYEYMRSTASLSTQLRKAERGSWSGSSNHPMQQIFNCNLKCL